MTTRTKNVEVKTVAETSVNNEVNNEVITANVVKVMLPENSDNRVTLVLDKEITTIDFTIGEEKQTTMFGINIYNLVNQVSANVEAIALADALAMGAMINPQIVALSLTNAEIAFVRTHHDEGEERAFEGTYAHECYTTEIKGVKTHIKPMFQTMLDKLIMSAPCIVKKVSVNPFNI